MRRPFFVFAASALVLSVVAGGCAGDKAPDPPQPAAKEAPAQENATAPKVIVRWLTGTIETLDPEAGTLTVKGRKGSMEFTADENARKELGTVKVGDKVIVKHSGDTALAIVKPGPDNTAKARKANEDSGKGSGLVLKPE